MDYLTPTLGEANTIPDLPEGVTFDFKHGFLQMLENNLFSGVAHKDPRQHLRKFIKLTYIVRRNQVPTEYIRLYVFLSLSMGRHGIDCAHYLRTVSLHGTSAQVSSYKGI